jgi:PKHD-type hydroxylase
MPYTTIYNDPYSRAKFIEPWVYWDDAFTDEELEKIVMYCEQFDLDYGVIFGSADKEEVEQHRVSSVKFHNRSPDTAWIFDRLNFVIQSVNEIYYNFHLNGYSKFQYTTYDAAHSGHYDWHMDTAMGKIEHSDLEMRKLSITLCLNDEYEGGNFCINTGTEEKSENLPMKKGRIILFPSFMIHKVAPVTKGTRRSLVVWVLGPKFQ